MDKKKIYQQKLLARILMFCAGVILIVSYLNNRIGGSSVFGLLFLVVGTVTLRKAKQAEEQLKN